MLLSFRVGELYIDVFKKIKNNENCIQVIVDFTTVEDSSNCAFPP